MTIERLDFEKLMRTETTEADAAKKGEKPLEKIKKPQGLRKWIGLGVFIAALGAHGDPGEKEKLEERQEEKFLPEKPKKNVNKKAEEVPILRDFLLAENGVCEEPEVTSIAKPKESGIVDKTKEKTQEEPLRELSANEALRELEKNPERFLQQYGFMTEYFAKNTSGECETFYGYVVTKAKDFYEGHNRRMVLVRKSFRNVAKHAPTIFEAAEKYQVPYGVALGMAILESKCRADLVSRAGAKGIMQLMAETAREQGLKVDDKTDERENARKNIFTGMHYLRRLYNRFGRWDVAALAYNMGPGNYKRLFRETLGKEKGDKIADNEVNALNYNCTKIYQEELSKNFYPANAEAHLRMYLWYLQESRGEELAENEKKFKNPAE